jgi:hypothetical protein
VQARRSSESTIAVETFMNNAGWIHQTDELVMAIEGDLELKFQGRRFHPRDRRRSIDSRPSPSHSLERGKDDGSMVVRG